MIFHYCLPGVKEAIQSCFYHKSRLHSSVDNMKKIFCLIVLLFYFIWLSVFHFTPFSAERDNSSVYFILTEGRRGIKWASVGKNKQNQEGGERCMKLVWTVLLTKPTSMIRLINTMVEIPVITYFNRCSSLRVTGRSTDFESLCFSTNHVDVTKGP